MGVTGLKEGATYFASRRGGGYHFDDLSGIVLAVAYLCMGLSLVVFSSDTIQRSTLVKKVASVAINVGFILWLLAGFVYVSKLF